MGICSRFSDSYRSFTLIAPKLPAPGKRWVSSYIPVPSTTFIGQMLWRLSDPFRKQHLEAANVLIFLCNTSVQAALSFRYLRGLHGFNNPASAHSCKSRILKWSYLLKWSSEHWKMHMGKGSLKTAQPGLSLLPFPTGIIYYCRHVNEAGFDGRAIDKAPLSIFFYWHGEFWRGESLHYKWSEMEQSNNRGIILVFLC